MINKSNRIGAILIKAKLVCLNKLDGIAKSIKTVILNEVRVKNLYRVLVGDSSSPDKSGSSE